MWVDTGSVMIFLNSKKSVNKRGFPFTGNYRFFKQEISVEVSLIQISTVIISNKKISSFSTIGIL